MTRDGGGSDGACSSSDSAAATALVASIRARVVEYKELLLRQLMDQRVALLAIDDVAADAKAKRIAKEKPSTEDTPPAEEPKEEDAEDEENAEEEEDEEEEEEEEEDEAMEEEDSTVVATADVEMTAVQVEAEAETPDTEMNGHAEPIATEEEDDEEEPEDADRKRRASVEPVVETLSKPESTEEPPMKESKPAEVPVVVPAPRVVKRIRRACFSTGDHPPPPIPGGRPVARSSTPPRRYLDHRDELLDDTHLQLVLRSPTRPLKTTTTKPRAASSLEDVQADFDQKLLVTMRLQRDVNRRSVAVTRKRQLPRLPTPARSKSHWDYLLEEMRWMAMDFSQERNWKRGIQWHLAKDVVVARNAERVRREKETRQLAKEMAMQVAAFWRTMERIAARSQVRFEGGGGSAQSERVDDKAQESEKKEDSGESAGDLSSGAENVPVLRFKTLELESSEGVEARKSVEARLHEILSTSRRARSSLSASAADALDSEREQAIQRVLEKRSAAAASVVSTSTVLATFQIVALRWMLELCLSGCNVLLNDQVGMGQSATISAFLSIVQELRVDETALDVSHPHLVIVPADELHKWCFFLHEWNQSHGIIQLYHGSPTQRKRLQGEWVKKLTVPQFFSSDEVADLEKEDSTPLFAVVCSAEDFVADQHAFRALSQWRTVVVEVEHERLREEDVAFVQSLSEIKHSGRRVLSCSQPLESWPSSKTRTAYAEFLVRDSEETSCDLDAWTKGTILEKTSAVEVVRWFGNKTGSTALLKSQQEHLNALTVAIQCLSLRRLRSEVESELGKLEETSVACALSESQQTQYRHAITAFAASSAADRISLWLQLVLKLRSLCNCVDVLNDAEKLALADVPFLLGCSGKLQQLHELLTRVVGKEHRRVVVYCQLDAMLNVVEMLLALMDIAFVYVTGSVEMQRRALCHFALKPAVQVALVSTRLASMGGKQAMPVYGADAIVVLDSDWQATCDAKLRASWAKCVVGNLPVFRFHCDATIEAALLRSGSCFSEKVFSEMGPQELLAAGDGALKIEKPVWWTPNGVAATTLAEAMAQVEVSEQYCASALANTLKVVNVELDAEEHLLLANADELMPVEWYAVNYLASSSTSEKKRLEQEQGGNGSEGNDSLQLTTSSPRRNMTTLEQLAVQESRRVREEVEVAGDMFYETEEESGLSELMLESVLRLLRAKGMEPHYEMVLPPQPPAFAEIVDSEPSSTSENASPEMLFRVSYREPAPPAPPPSLILKLRTDASTAAALASVGGADSSGKPLKVKKRNKDLAGRAPGAPGSTVAASAHGAGGAGASTVAGIKRKHDGAASSKPPKEPRLDFDGIPLPSDMAEFADDDFWGDTNLDALDSAAWDDPAVLSGILGPTLDVPPSSTGSAATASSGTGATSGQTTKKKSKAGAAAGGAGASAQGGAGRARKGSMSESNKDGGWQVQDDLVLKKLFEMYGSNWTLIAHVFNAATSVSRFVVRKRTPRQCYDRYGKIISSGSLTLSGSSALLSATASPTKDGSVKSTSSSLLKQHKLNAAAAALWTPQVLAERIGLPTNEMLLVFAARDSLPGLPPPSIVNVPSLAELSMKKKKKKQHGQGDAVATPGAPVLDDLKSIRTSFDAILQCMKRKTPPPPIPIPQASTAPVPDPSAASSTAASPTKSSIVTPVPTSVPPPHKSHMDLVELLPRGALTPEEVIKRSKEAAAVAVQAAAAVASAGRSQEISPLASAGDVLMNAAFGSNSAAAIAARKAGANTVAGGARTGGFAAASVTAPSKTMGMSPSAGSWGDPAAAALSRPPHAAPPLPHPTTTPGLIAQPTSQPQQPVVSSSMNGVVSASTPSSRGLSAAGSPAMPVTTSALLHVLDRMPEIKHKIQAILNRTDCSEAQKVAMIARLLSNTNAINATAVAAAASGNLSAAVSATLGASSTAATPTGSAASTAGSGPPTPAPTDLSSGFGQSLDTPIPMPASLATESSGPLPIPMPASIGNATLASTTTSSAMSDAALASALADTDMTELP